MRLVFSSLFANLEDVGRVQFLAGSHEAHAKRCQVAHTTMLVVPRIRSGAAVGADEIVQLVFPIREKRRGHPSWNSRVAGLQGRLLREKLLREKLLREKLLRGRARRFHAV